jgi:hypothetical protein
MELQLIPRNPELPIAAILELRENRVWDFGLNSDIIPIAALFILRW